MFFQGVDAEEHGWELIEAGAQGIEILDQDRLRVFLGEGVEVREAVLERAQLIGLIFQGEAELPDVNWVQQCEDLMRPLEVGDCRIQPLVRFEDKPGEADPSAIYLIPGAGFGTGHHPTTGLLLALLQLGEVRRLVPRSIADVGTGSGILSIYCAKTYSAKVQAIDTDELALENARENIALNRLEANIEICLGSTEQLFGPYDLVLANLYAELLLEFRVEFERVLPVGGLLLISGVADDLWQDVLRGYQGQTWKFLKEEKAQGWNAALLQKTS